MRRPLLAVVLASTIGCPVEEEPPPGVGGLDGVLAFEAPTELVFTNNLSVSSHFEITVRPLDSEAVAFADDVDVGVSAATAAVTVAERSAEKLVFGVVFTEPGAVRLAVSSGGEVLDRVDLTAVPPATTLLVDGALLPYAGVLDASLPAAFNFLTERTTSFGVAAIDRCGTGILDLGASSLVVADDAGLTLGVTDLGGLTVDTELPSATTVDLVLQSPGLEPLTYRVKAVTASAVDEVRVGLVAADSAEGTFTAWARPFADGSEVIGLEDVTWAGNARVALASAVGPVVDGVVDFAANDDPEFPADAILTASGLGEEGSINLLAVQSTDVVSARSAAPTRPGDDDDDDDTDTSTGGASCAGDAPVCDPLAALLPLWGLRRLRRLRQLDRRRR